MGHKAFNGIGDRHAVDQQDWVDGKEVEQRNQFTGPHTKMFFNHFSDIFARLTA
ncbi:hypothetical protein D3C87_2114770 [compost metagenome]